jgi:hypothetical protein
MTCLETRPHLQTLYLAFRFQRETRSAEYLFADCLQIRTKLGRNLFANCLPTMFVGVYKPLENLVSETAQRISMIYGGEVLY